METPAFRKASKQKLKGMLFTKLGQNSLKYYAKGFPYWFFSPHALTSNIFSNMEIQYWLSHMAQQIEPQHSETPMKAGCSRPPVFKTISPILHYCILSSSACAHMYQFIICKPHKGPVPITQPNLRPLHLVHRHVTALTVAFQSLNDSKLFSTALWWEISLRSLYTCSLLSLWDWNHSVDLSRFTEVPEQHYLQLIEKVQRQRLPDHEQGLLPSELFLALLLAMEQLRGDRATKIIFII